METCRGVMDGQHRSASWRTEGYGPTGMMSAEVISQEMIDAYLDLEQVITADALVVHLIISIFSITAIFVLNKCKSVGV